MLPVYESDAARLRHEKTLHSARRILSLVLELVPGIRSAVDLGCATGTWLSVLSDKGIRDVLGLDGPWVDAATLQIPREKFRFVDLGGPLDLDRRFDLALSLEVGEHLPESSADRFVHSLTSLSDIVLFSAAIPGQGGDRHVNEQWPEYWAERFDNQGYRVFDCVRGTIWNDSEIPYWYRQNVMLYATGMKAKAIEQALESRGEPGRVPLSMAHPELFERMVRERYSPKEAWTLLRRTLKARIKRSLPGGRD